MDKCKHHYMVHVSHKFDNSIGIVCALCDDFEQDAREFLDNVIAQGERIRELEGLLSEVFPLFEEMAGHLFGGCDHEVGICMCKELDLIERMKEVTQEGQEGE